jgi:hypothetical protein
MPIFACLSKWSATPQVQGVRATVLAAVRMRIALEYHLNTVIALLVLLCLQQIRSHL